MKTPKKRRMGIYIILEIFENLGSQMGIYIYIYTHTPLYMKVIRRSAGSWDFSEIRPTSEGYISELKGS